MSTPIKIFKTITAYRPDELDAKLDTYVRSVEDDYPVEDYVVEWMFTFPSPLMLSNGKVAFIEQTIAIVYERDDVCNCGRE